MASEKKKKVQYNWKFKGNESEEFYQWFENQDNIAFSLKNIVEQFIQLYGTENVLNPRIQKELAKDAIILEHLRGKDSLIVNQQLILEVYKPNRIEQKNDNAVVIDKEEDKREKPIDTKETLEIKASEVVEQKNEKKPKVDYKAVNPNSI